MNVSGNQKWTKPVYGFAVLFVSFLLLMVKIFPGQKCIHSGAFQGNGGWYIENSLTTIGRKQPHYYWR
jgi:hypothetical protein